MNSAEDTVRPLNQSHDKGFNSFGGSNIFIVGIL